MNNSGDAEIVFVHPAIESVEQLDEDVRQEGLVPTLLRCSNGRDAWILSTYLQLRQRGMPVRLSPCFVPDRICFAHRDDHAAALDLWRSFTVCVRADRERAFTANMEVVQSPAVVDNLAAHYMPHWPQPGLMPRDQARGDSLYRIGFFGPAKNLAAELRSPAFTEQLRELGMELVIREARQSWNDYRDIDAVVAIRDGAPYFLAGKPPAKLINAWRAGCPAIVGSEPAFHHYGCHGRDFLYATNAAEALTALKRLKEEPGLYARMRQRAIELGRDWSAEPVAALWMQFVHETVRPAYERWYRRPLALRRSLGLLGYAWGRFRRRLRGNLYSRGYDLQGQPIERKQTRKRRLALQLDAWLSRRDHRRLLGSRPADGSSDNRTEA
jgi:hypothetical protein